jgi:hypothetical protein
MPLNNLQILHIYKYSKPKGQESPLQQFIKKVKPISLSTCMRHVYIFSADQLNDKDETLQNLTSQMNNPPPHQCKIAHDYLTGQQAYSFLLFWIVGGLNNKAPFNDQRILGDIRKEFHRIEHGASPRNATTWSYNKYFINSLRADTKHLLHWVSQLDNEMEFSIKSTTVREACDNCSWARDEGFLTFTSVFDYGAFCSKENTITALYKKLDILSDKCIKEEEKGYVKHGEIGFIFSQTRLHLQKKLEDITVLRAKLDDMQSKSKENEATQMVNI